MRCALRRRRRGPPWLLLSLTAIAVIWTINRAGEPARDPRTRDRLSLYRNRRGA